jgi:photosystem II stability/assembly factor-like uncharacterized protein
VTLTPRGASASRTRDRTTSPLVASLLLLGIAACGDSGGPPPSAPQKTVIEAPTASASINATSTPEVDTFPSTEITFAGPSHGLAIFGHEVVRTADGGRSWRRAYLADGPIRDVQWVDSTLAVAVGAAGLLRSDDGGATWRAVEVKSPAKDLVRISVVDTQSAYAATVDGGLWRIHLDGQPPVRVGIPGVSGVAAVTFPDARHGWVVGDQGVAATTDGGLTWRLQTTQVLFGAPWLRPAVRMHFADLLHGYVVLPQACAAGTCYSSLEATDDGGAHWVYRSASAVGAPPTPAYESLPGGVWDVTPTGPRSLLAGSSSNGNVERADACISADGGRSWSCRGGSVPQPPVVVAIAMPRPGQLEAALLMVAANPSDEQLVLAGSVDGGITWTVNATFPVTSGSGGQTSPPR